MHVRIIVHQLYNHYVFSDESAQCRPIYSKPVQTDRHLRHPLINTLFIRNQPVVSLNTLIINKNEMFESRHFANSINTRSAILHFNYYLTLWFLFKPGFLQWTRTMKVNTEQRNEVHFRPKKNNQKLKSTRERERDKAPLLKCSIIFHKYSLCPSI